MWRIASLLRKPALAEPIRVGDNVRVLVGSATTALRLVAAGEFKEIWRRVSRRPHVRLSPPASVASHPDLRNDGLGCSHAHTSVHRFRALLFAPNLALEGAPLSQLDLTCALAQRGVIEPEIISVHDGPLRARYESAGISVRICEPCLSDMPTPARYEAAVERMVALIRARAPAVVYANTLLNFVAIAAAHRARVPSVWNVREGEPPEEFFAFLSGAVATRAVACLSLPYRVIFVAPATAETWARFNTQGNFSVIRNGVDLSRFNSTAGGSDRHATRAALGVSADELLVLAVGTVCERKSQKDLVAALSRLPDALLANVRAVIVGNEPDGYGRALRREIAKCAARVSLVPACDDVTSYYRAADVFVLTSRNESFPRVTVEAMGHELPIIAARTGGVAEQVWEGHNALLYAPGDIAVLAGHLLRVLSEPTLRAAMRSASRPALARLASFDQMVDEYAVVFRGAYATGGTGPLRGVGWSETGPLSPPWESRSAPDR